METQASNFEENGTLLSVIFIGVPLKMFFGYLFVFVCLTQDRADNEPF